MQQYNEERTHSGKYHFKKAPRQTFLDSLLVAKEKTLCQTMQTIAQVAEVPNQVLATTPDIQFPTSDL